MNREVHVRIWERPEVRVLRATRHEERFPPPRLSGRCVFRKRLVVVDDYADVGFWELALRNLPNWTRFLRLNRQFLRPARAARLSTYVSYALLPALRSRASSSRTATRLFS